MLEIQVIAFILVMHSKKKKDFAVIQSKVDNFRGYT